MKISIITVCYNSQKTIESTIQSVLRQDYSDIEYIIVDGDSYDGTREVLRKYKANISKIISEKDNGLYDALNKGIKIASGEIIGILHSDDVFDNNGVITKVAEVFKKINCDGVYGDLVYTKENDLSEIVRYWKSRRFKKELLNYGWMPAHPTLFLKRQVYDLYGKFDLEFKIAGDYDFMLRILKQNQLKFSYLPLVITRMRLGGASNGSPKYIYYKSIEDYRIIKKNKIGGLLTLLAKNLSKVGQFFKVYD